MTGLTDLCPEEYAACHDLDADGCIDLPDVDGDTDGVTAGQCDCNESDPDIWGTPSEVRNLALSRDPVTGMTTLTWTLPVEPGGAVVPYDVIRSASRSDFVTSAVCIESGDSSDMTATDSDDPSPSSALYYLVRGANDCALGEGTVGNRSNLVLRTARSCP